VVWVDAEGVGAHVMGRLLPEWFACLRLKGESVHRYPALTYLGHRISAVVQPALPFPAARWPHVTVGTYGSQDTGMVPILDGPS